MLLVRISNGDGQTVLIVRHTIFVVCMDCIRPQELLQLSESNASVPCFPVGAVVGTLLLGFGCFRGVGLFYRVKRKVPPTHQYFLLEVLGVTISNLEIVWSPQVNCGEAIFVHRCNSVSDKTHTARTSQGHSCAWKCS